MNATDLAYIQWRSRVFVEAQRRGIAWALGDEPDDFLAECYDDDMSPEDVSDVIMDSLNG